MRQNAMTEHHIFVRRTARFYTLGAPGTHVKETWFVCHGYGQLARFFLRHFAILDGGSRLIVAPEGLSRAYLENMSGRVGASWMTKEDRENEIADYVAYLNQVYDEILQKVNPESKITLLGFSQGTATVCRWFDNGHIRADQLIIWAGLLPPDFDLSSHRQTFLKTKLHMALGKKDEYATPNYTESQRENLAQHRIPYQFHSFNGGHRLDPEILKKIAGE